MARKSTPVSISRRKSPSVKIPSRRCWASVTAAAPRPLTLISRISSPRLASGRTAGTAWPWRITSATRVSSLRPSAPPGCERAKSSGLKPRACSSATASASPMASWAVVLAVGAKFSGQASWATLVSSTMSACCASEDCALPVSATSITCKRRRVGKIALSSALSPLLEIASTTSADVIMPRSPWLASPGCTNMAGVPVDARVAAILRPMWPLLPMPITTTRPLQRKMACTASVNSGPMRSPIPNTAAASISKVLRARATACAGSKAGRSNVMRLILSSHKAASLLTSWLAL